MIDWIITQFKANEFFSGTMITALLLGMGYYLKQPVIMLWYGLTRRFLYTITFDTRDSFFTYFNKFLRERYPEKIRNVRLRLTSLPDEREDALPSLVTFKAKEAFDLFPRVGTFILWYQGHPLLVQKVEQKLENASNFLNMMFDQYSITGFLSKKYVDNMANEVMHYSNAGKAKGNFDVYTCTKDSWRYCRACPPRLKKSVIHPRRDEILSDLLHFTKSRKWYSSRGIAHKRAYLFHGEPGTGKSTMVHLMASVMGWPVYFLNLTGKEFGDAELHGILTEIRKPGIVLFEDIDSAFTGRVAGDHVGVTFSGLLNCLDGLPSMSDCIIIFTTNHRDRLDPALIRPGRVDREFEFGLSSSKDVQEYFGVFYDMEDKDREKCGPFLAMPLSYVERVCFQFMTDSKKAEAVLKDSVQLFKTIGKPIPEKVVVTHI